MSLKSTTARQALDATRVGLLACLLALGAAAIPRLAHAQTKSPTSPTPSTSQPAPTQPSVPAQQGNPPIVDNAVAAFQLADTNNDGKLSRQEAAALPAVAAKFDELDVDKDGFLSLQEFTTGYTSGAVTPDRRR